MELKVVKAYCKEELQNWKMADRKFSKQYTEKKNKNEKYRRYQ